MIKNTHILEGTNFYGTFFLTVRIRYQGTNSPVNFTDGFLSLLYNSIYLIIIL